MAVMNLDTGFSPKRSVTVDSVTTPTPRPITRTTAFRVAYVRVDDQQAVHVEGPHRRAASSGTADASASVLTRSGFVHSILMGASRILGVFGDRSPDRAIDDVVADRIVRAIEHTTTERTR